MSARTNSWKRSTAGLALVGLLALLVVGCARTVNVRTHPALARMEPIQKIAVVPFRASGDLLRARPASDAEKRVDVLESVSHHVNEALVRRRLPVVAPADMAQAMGGTPEPDARPVPIEMAKLANSQFGANAILMGQVWRYRERTGTGASSRSPASVGFEVTLYAAPGGQRLWTGTFDETQKPFGENVLTTAQYPGGGARWLSVDELTRWGADQTVLEMPTGGTGAAPPPR